MAHRLFCSCKKCNPSALDILGGSSKKKPNFQSRGNKRLIMQNLSLIKSHPSIQLAHLYEHLFMRSINELFFEKGLYKFLDYSSNGMTYDKGGLVIIECSLYTQDAKKLIKEIERLDIDLGEKNSSLNIALQQIMAEEDNQLVVGSSSEIIKELQTLNNTPWQHLTETDTIDTNLIEPAENPLYLTDTPQLKADSLSLSINLDKNFADKNEHLLPLFYVMSRILILNISTILNWKYGTYTGQKISNSKAPTEYSVELQTASTDFRSNIDIEKLLAHATKIAKHITSNRTLQRLAGELLSITNNNNTGLDFDYEDILLSTGILVGSEGWSKMANITDMTSLLDQTTVSIHLDQKQATSSLR